MAESVVSFVLHHLSNLLQNEGNDLLGLRRQIVYIRDEIRHMKAFLVAADSIEESDPQLEEWVREVRKISYNIEDVLDIYMLRFGNRSENDLRGRGEKMYDSMINLSYHREIVSKIQTIKSRVESASQSYQRYKDTYPLIGQESNYSSSNNSSYDGRGDALLLEDAEVVGIEKPKKQFLQWLLAPHSGVKVISVVGMGGLGKTTLIKKVYDDQLVKKNFDHHVWITVSESYKIDHLLRSMIKFLVDEIKQPRPQEIDSMNADRMREFIYEFLLNKKYIIVLDDIWRIDAWDAIKYAFPRSATKGCGYIIITTRFKSIGNATSCETVGRVYNLEPLPEEESKQLFYMKAFRGNPCPPHFKKISEVILRRCEGLPLAIVVIGALLATKNNNFEDWEVLSHNLGDELDGENLRRMKKIINLSFYDLPYYLKSCFLYLSIFPEDELLERWRLIRLWTAHGFVQEKQGKTLEEIAQGYINELLNRSLIQIAMTSAGGTPTRFRIHDILRDYIISKSKHEVVVARNGEMILWPDEIRRIALDTFFTIQESHRFHNLRSLLWSGSGNSDHGEILNKVLGRGCRFLKELDLRGAPIESIPHEVFKLYHLKYLSLRSTKVKLIPVSIKNLKNTSVTQLPIEVLKLQRLRNLLVYSYEYDNDEFPITQWFKAPYEIGRLSSLQKLMCVSADEVYGVKIVREIGKLTQLRKLGFRNLKKEDEVELCSSLTKLPNLRSLNLIANDEDEVIDLEHSMSSFTFPFLRTLVLAMRLEKLPLWISRLHGLTILTIRCSRLRNRDPL